MEAAVIRSAGRGRKRRRKDVSNALLDRQTKKRAVETRWKALMGRYVKKEFKGSGTFLGKIVFYDSGLYRVDYEDGDFEDLESGEVMRFLIGDDFDDNLIARKKKLDELLSKKDVKTKEVLVGNVMDSVNTVDGVEALSSSELSNSGANEIDGVQVDGDASSSSNSCEYDRDSSLEVEASLVSPPQLPPSSGNIGVPVEFVSHLFSVYSFLRSFSIRLFLSPFTLNDFVGSLNCPVPNTLLDAIHVALMCALRRHLETLSSDGSVLALKCLRCIDWSLLDTLTWPVYLVQYLMVMGYTKGTEWKEFYIDVLERDYYTLSAGRKLIILQILCDNVLDSAELRAEIDMREESEVGIDSDAVVAFTFESGPRRVHPRYSKTSACKDQEAMEIIAESHEMKSSCNSSYLGFKGTEPNADAGVDQDGNGDECRLCGMDGTLLCCDGCPSAYHSRCIGVSKMSIPEGAWYCPECTISKIGPTIAKGTSLRGAEVFGVDLYGQVFLGTCNHLLVLKISINSEPCLRYYSQNEIPKVLQALCSSVEHIASYVGICKGILQYWEIPEDVSTLLERVEIGLNLVNRKEDGKCLTPSLTLLGKKGHKVLDMVEVVEGENFASCVTESSVENVAVSSSENCCREPGFNNISFGTMTRTDHPGQQRNSEATARQVCPLIDTNFSKQIKVESTMSAGSVRQHTGPPDLMHQSLADKSSVIKFAPCTSGNSNGSYKGHMNGTCVAPNMSLHNKEGEDRVSQRGEKILADDLLSMGSPFKPQAYINHYIHGDFAASAAANLAILSSEEKQVSESHALNNPRKVMSANISLQVKAFSSAAIRFFWPNSEKKLVEVPRERCGWCLSCKAPVTSKKGCLLNAAASNAIKGAAKIPGLRHVKNGEGSLPGIATYVMFMEESLCGLTVGPFLSATYRRQWRKQVEQAKTCSAIKSLLLEFEENIRIIALSEDWVKLMDDWSVESSLTQTATFAVGSTQKRGPSGRRRRKQSSMPEVRTDNCHENLRDFIWWRGGMLSKLIFQKGILPRSLVKKAARQGGSKKIPGIYYAEGYEVPKRSRQFVWRAAVEMSRNASQLALQVRFLDLHVRWGDLVRPEQNLQDAKGPETEASAFRNAFICDKKIMESKIKYGVAFGNQKHLPSRVMKNIIEVEQSHDGKDKYWFSETRIPLYLIKEYEENVEKMLLPLADKPMNALSKLQRRQLKASCKDIFSYLSRKRDNLDKCSCVSCQLDVFLGNAVKCSACQGYCHDQCTISSTVHANEEVEFLIICKQCSHTKALTQNENSNVSPTSPLLLRGKEFQDAVTVTKGAKQKGYDQPLTSVGTLERSFEMRPATCDSSLATKSQRKCSWGLIWKKKNVDDTDINFRLKNILLRGNPDTTFSGPVCHLCEKPYNSDLMYICCETCKNWYHAEAVELKESKIFDLVGFKCCRCRRIKSPVCPYMNPGSKKQLKGKKPHTRAPKQGNSGIDLGSGTISEPPEEGEPATPVLPTKEEVYIQEDDPLLFSLSRVEQFTEPNSKVDVKRNTAIASGPGPGPQKLPVRRHMKCESDVNGFSANNQSHIDLSSNLEANNLPNPTEESLSPHVEWDVSTNGLEDGMMLKYENLNYEDMEFEPQTYFSFTELLVSDDGGQLSDDGGQLDGVDASGNVLGNRDNLYTLSPDGNMEQSGMSASSDQQEPSIAVEPAGDIVPCQKCSRTEPCPNLSCQICGLRIHSHCSPWVEQSSWEGSWRCGSCRDWR